MRVETVPAAPGIHRGQSTARVISSVRCAKLRRSSPAASRTEEVFAAISEQAARVCGVGEGGGGAVQRGGAAIVGRWGEAGKERCYRGVDLRPGWWRGVDPGGETGLPARFDDYAIPQGDGRCAAPARAARERGRAGLSRCEWGVLVVSAPSRRDTAGDAEERLTAVHRAGRRWRSRAPTRTSGCSIPRAPRAHRRRRAPAARAQPARRRAAAARERAAGAADAAQPGADDRRRSTRSATSCARPTRTCASSPAACIRRRSRAGDRRDRRARDARLGARRARRRRRALLPTSSRSPSTTSPARR